MPTRQFHELTNTEVRHLVDHLAEQLAAWLFDHEVAGADRAVDWAISQRIANVVRHDHEQARRRVVTLKQRTPRRPPIKPFERRGD